jgi:ABC-2 type transport system permease protein
MIGANFWHTLKRNTYQVTLWGGGLALLAILLFLVINDNSMIEQYGKVMETFPPEMLSAFGADDMEALSTPDGFIAFGFFSYILIITAIYAVNAGLDITATDEDEGMMDIVLTLPVLRGRLVIERFLAFVVITVMILLVSFGGFLIGTQVSNVEISLGGMLLGLLSMIPSVLFMIALVMFCGVLFRRKTNAMAVAVAVILVSYFIDMMAMTTTNEIVQTLSHLSFFTYAKIQTVVTDGIVWRDMVVLTLGTGVLLSATLYLFNRRDVGL